MKKKKEIEPRKEKRNNKKKKEMSKKGRKNEGNKMQQKKKDKTEKPSDKERQGKDIIMNLLGNNINVMIHKKRQGKLLEKNDNAKLGKGLLKKEERKEKEMGYNKFYLFKKTLKRV